MNLLRPKDVAQLLGLAESTVRAYVARGQVLPPPDSPDGAATWWLEETITAYREATRPDGDLLRIPVNPESLHYLSTALLGLGLASVMGVGRYALDMDGWTCTHFADVVGQTIADHAKEHADSQRWDVPLTPSKPHRVLGAVWPPLGPITRASQWDKRQELIDAADPRSGTAALVKGIGYPVTAFDPQAQERAGCSPWIFLHRNRGQEVVRGRLAPLARQVGSLSPEEVIEQLVTPVWPEPVTMRWATHGPGNELDDLSPVRAWLGLMALSQLPVRPVAGPGPRIVWRTSGHIHTGTSEHLVLPVPTRLTTLDTWRAAIDSKIPKRIALNRPQSTLAGLALEWQQMPGMGVARWDVLREQRGPLVVRWVTGGTPFGPPN